MLPALPYYTGAGWYVQQKGRKFIQAQDGMSSKKAENIVFFEELYISQNPEDTL